MIKLNNKINITSLEKAYQEVFKSKEIDILISRSLSGIDFGLTPAIIQFIATWYNISKSGKLILDIKAEGDIAEFYKLDYLFPSIVYCWDRDIVDTNGNDLKPFLKLQNELKHSKMKTQEDGGGPKMMLSCFDHLPTKKGLLSAFYIDETFIDNEFQFDLALNNTLVKVFTYIKNLHRSNLAKNHSDIIAIIYELMKNTHDWGRTDIYNKPLNPNSRGLFMKLHQRKREGFMDGFEDHIGLRDFFSQKNFESNALDELHFLEISVYDTGVGFVERYKKKSTNNYSTDEQVNIVKQCLLENNTSAIGIEKTYKGKGLDRIMRILDGKGFFWLRTGNVSIFRNLKQNIYKSQCSTDEIDLFDWFNNSTNNFSHLTNVKGSVITLVYPFSNLANV